MQNLNDIYERVERYDNAHIHTQSYESLNIKCETLLLDSDGKAKYPSPFFEPRGASWVPNIDITDDDMRETFQVFNDNWDATLTTPLMRRSPETQAYHFCSWLEHMFHYFQRDRGYSPDVASLSKWRSRFVIQLLRDTMY
jgi:hypothetical protein